MKGLPSQFPLAVVARRLLPSTGQSFFPPPPRPRIGRKEVGTPLETIRRELEQEIEDFGTKTVSNRLKEEEELLKSMRDQRKAKDQPFLERIKDMLSSGAKSTFAQFWRTERNRIETDDPQHRKREDDQMDWMQARQIVKESLLGPADNSQGEPSSSTPCT